MRQPRSSADWLRQHRPARLLAGFGSSLGGVALVTWLISLVSSHYHIANISMVYLLLVMALAVYAGSGPAIFASVLAFLAFDWFFVAPVGRLTVSDPDEWLALVLFLAVAIITGQLAAGLRRRAEEARRRARETQALYELSMAILGDTNLVRVLQVIAERMVATLHLQHASIWLAGEGGALLRTVEAGTAERASLTTGKTGERDESEETDRDAQDGAWESGVRWAFESARPAAQYGRGNAVQIVRPLDQSGRHAGDESEQQAAFVPILLDKRPAGVVVARPGRHGEPIAGERARLLEAFAAQTGLAVSRARLAEEEERSRSAAESDRLKSTFLASISHDLRTPLTAIKAAAAGLRTEHAGGAAGSGRELAASIEREVDRLNRLVGNLLEMSRLEAGGLPPAKAPEDLAEIVGTVVGRLSAPLATRHFTVMIPPDLPFTWLDAGQIDRVISNLMENAIKYSPPAGRIVLEASAEAGMLRVSLYNDAPPLSEEERVRIFDKFYRLDRAASAGGGTGLGLAICKGIVEAHGGSIKAENDPGGVHIVFTLPLGQTAGTSRPAAAAV